MTQKNLLSAGLFLKYLQWPRQDQAKSWSLKLNPGLPDEQLSWTRAKAAARIFIWVSKHLGRLGLLCRGTCRKLYQKWSSSTPTPIWDALVCRQLLNLLYHNTGPQVVLFFFF